MRNLTLIRRRAKFVESFVTEIEEQQFSGQGQTKPVKQRPCFQMLTEELWNQSKELEEKKDDIKYSQAINHVDTGPVSSPLSNEGGIVTKLIAVGLVGGGEMLD